ncbi:hypothetical protein C4571_02390 [Candidatus Parcubacteria bacterium]|nr:MAG: hypothetical protein C4571_02390 [Candidatus Parcubacteria bacterium]
MCTVVPKTIYRVRFNGFRLAGLPVEVVVIREAMSWNIQQGEELDLREGHFEGDVHLEAGDRFLIFVRGLSIEEARRVFWKRAEGRLIAPGESFSYRHDEQGFFACVTDNPKFPVVGDGFPYPVNIVPELAVAAAS